MEIFYSVLIFLFVIAIIAGWVDAIAGGGGFLVLPALLLSGIPPDIALATNKLQGSFGTATSSFYFLRRKLVSLRAIWLSVLLTYCGATLGGWTLLQIDSSYMMFLVPVFLMLIGGYFLCFATDLDSQKKEKLSQRAFDLGIAPCLGFYDGIFGPGMGSLTSLAYNSLRGFSIVLATAHAKIINFTSNIAALVYFLYFGEIYFTVGFVMICGQMIGAYVGARTVLQSGSALIRPMIIIVCFGMSARILWDLIV